MVTIYELSSLEWVEIFEIDSSFIHVLIPPWPWKNNPNHLWNNDPDDLIHTIGKMVQLSCHLNRDKKIIEHLVENFLRDSEAPVRKRNLEVLRRELLLRSKTEKDDEMIYDALKKALNDADWRVSFEAAKIQKSISA